MIAPISSEKSTANTDYDAVVIGGSFSGSSLAWLVKRHHPNARILIIEKSKEFDRKVGESTSEVAGCFLTKVLRLGPHLARKHIAKHGLHLWFNDGKNTCPSRCTEVGPNYQVRLPTYQVSRSILDQHLLDRSIGDGCELVRPATVRELELSDSDAPHQITFRDGDGNHRTVSTKWIVDASGRAALIARKRKTLKTVSEHPVNSMWVRFKNVRDFDSIEMDTDQPGVGTAGRAPRFNSTNHLVGFGWWCWLIPLENGEMSAGLTWDSRYFTPDKEGKIGEQLKRHLVANPIGKALFEHAEAVENDSRTYSKLPYYSSEPAGKRWIAIGDAAGFMDPLYSQGLDYCAHSTYIASKIINGDLAGDCPMAGLAEYNRQFIESYFRWFNAIYKDKYTYLGDADLMYAAFLLDLGTYFVGPVRLVYEHTDKEFGHMPYYGPAGKIFARFMALYNRRLSHIALKRRAAGTYGKNNLDKSKLVGEGFAPTLGAFKQIWRGTRYWIYAELDALRLPKPQSQPALTPATKPAKDTEPATI